MNFFFLFLFIFIPYSCSLSYFCFFFIRYSSSFSCPRPSVLYHNFLFSSSYLSVFILCFSFPYPTPTACSAPSPLNWWYIFVTHTDTQTETGMSVQQGNKHLHTRIVLRVIFVGPVVVWHRLQTVLKAVLGMDPCYLWLEAYLSSQTRVYDCITDWLTDWLTPQNRVLFEKLIVTQLVKKFSPFLEPKGSLPYSQQLATGPYP